MQIFSALVPLARVLLALAVVDRMVFTMDCRPGVVKLGESEVVPPLSQMVHEFVKGSLKVSKSTEGLLA
jgi:hypothetical protein